MRDVSSQTYVSRETMVDRRREPRAEIERASGKLCRNGGAWSDAQIETLKRLVAANCAPADIATHFETTTPAIRELARRNKIAWPKLPRPKVADILPPPGVPTVDYIDHLGRYVGKAELHEADDINRCRIRIVTGAGIGAAGQWKTVPAMLLHFAKPLDRAAELAAARARQQARLAAEQPPASGE